MIWIFLFHERFFKYCWDCLNVYYSGTSHSHKLPVNVKFRPFHASWYTNRNLLQIPAFALSVILVDKSGRRPLLMVRMADKFSLSYWVSGLVTGCWNFWLRAGFQHWIVLKFFPCWIGILLTGFSWDRNYIFWTSFFYNFISKIKLSLEQDHGYWKEITPILVYIGILVNTMKL